MKILPLVLFISTQNFSYAEHQPIHVRRDTPVAVQAEGCKTSEYTKLQLIGFEGEAKFHAKCAPKVCELRTYWGIFGGPSATVTLKPGDQVILEANSKQEAKDAIQKFIADGVCAQSGRFVPSI